MVDKTKLKDLRKEVKHNPSGPEVVELALALIDSPESRGEVREVCFQGLTANPSNYRLRLLLAKAFYLDGYADFALEQLVKLRDSIKVPSLDRLINAMGGSVKDSSEERQANSEGNISSGGGVSEEKDEVKDHSDENEEDTVLAELDIDADFVDAYDEATKAKKDKLK